MYMLRWVEDEDDVGESAEFSATEDEALRIFSDAVETAHPLEQVLLLRTDVTNLETVLRKSQGKGAP